MRTAGPVPEAGHPPRQQIAQETRHEPFDSQAEQHAEEAPEQPDDHRLAEVEGDDLVGARADAAQGRDGVDPGGEPGPHGLRHPDAADQQREERHQPEEAFDAPQSASQGRLRVDVRLHLIRPGGGEDRFDLFADLFDALGLHLRR